MITLVRVLALAVFALTIGACGPRRGTIGAVLGQNADGRLYVREVAPGLAAEKAKVRPGDEILLIDGLDARALGPKGVHEALSGEEGQPVRLTLVREGQIVRVTLKRTPPQRHALPGASE